MFDGFGGTVDASSVFEIGFVIVVFDDFGGTASGVFDKIGAVTVEEETDSDIEVVFVEVFFRGSVDKSFPDTGVEVGVETAETVLGADIKEDTGEGEGEGGSAEMVVDLFKSFTIVGEGEETVDVINLLVSSDFTL